MPGQTRRGSAGRLALIGAAVAAAAWSCARPCQTSWVPPVGEVNRADLARGSFLSAAAALLAGAPSAHADWGVRNVMPTDPPIPSPNAFIRKLQAKSWALEPILRQRSYLKAMKQRLYAQSQLGFGKNKYFVHWSLDSYKYDILEENQFNEATRLGLLLVDSDMSEPTAELPVFLYKNATDQAYVADKLGVYDLVELPDELVQAIEEVKIKKFDASRYDVKPGDDARVPAPQLQRQTAAPARTANEAALQQLQREAVAQRNEEFRKNQAEAAAAAARNAAGTASEATAAAPATATTAITAAAKVNIPVR